MLFLCMPEYCLRLMNQSNQEKTQLRRNDRIGILLRPAIRPLEGFYRQLSIAGIALSLVTVISYRFESDLSLAGVVIMYFLAVIVASYYGGVFASGASSVAAVILLNYFFIEPRHTFFVDTAESWATLVGLFVLSLLLSSLTFRLQKARTAAENEMVRAETVRQTLELLIGLEGRLEIQEVGLDRMFSVVKTPMKIFELTERNVRPVTQRGATFNVKEPLLRWAQKRSVTVGPGTDQPLDVDYWVFPLEPNQDQACVLAVKCPVTLPDAETENLDERFALHYLQLLSQQLGLALQNERSRRNEKIARKASNIISRRNRLLASIAHDLRTPLSSILGAAEAIDKVPNLDHEAQLRVFDLTSQIRDEGNQMVRVTDNVLAMVRLQFDDHRLKADWESVEEIIGSVVARYRNRFPDLAIKTSVDAAIPMLWVNGPLVSQAIENVISNSLKYASPERPIQISASKIGDTVAIEMADEGPGYPLQVFQAMQTLDDESSSSVDSYEVGLGLGICEAIMQTHGGSIELKNRKDALGGAVTRLIFPIRHLEPELDEHELS